MTLLKEVFKLSRAAVMAKNCMVSWALSLIQVCEFNVPRTTLRNIHFLKIIYAIYGKSL